MTELVLVRHGETAWHAENRYAGSSDVHLTEKGAEQGRELARWAAKNGEFAAVFCSPLSRCRRTAEPAAEATGLPLRREPRLREVHFGDGEGMTAEEMRRSFGDRLAAFHRDPAGSPLPGGESPAAAAERGVAALRDIAAAHPDGRVLAVSHNTLIRLVLCSVLGLPLSEYRRTFPELGNTAPTILRLREGRWSLIRFNAPLC
ncbi:putative phosphoglycerate mutase [Streptomyces sp. Amel2xB2]|uniref:histidine phosphatase family protein n=1 Tax=Streptomyces sp. Amel2xB2 TaxID=1305829 RepID=UPI000DB92549|nr:histidine phosphatase family protein [Streptomyces sp. Amel2xB2]RAJ70075.1 putative phosphoglycerate mutase [Streptomyces sp. Amel2xB2]